jgi:hypothetical protein
MSELINTKSQRNRRWQLMGTASVAAFLSVINVATAQGDSEQPVVWLELGGQFERLGDQPTLLTPGFFTRASSGVLAPMVDVQRSPPYAIGGQAKATFELPKSDWLLSAAVRYGRANSARVLHYQTANERPPQTLFGRPFAGVDNAKLGDGQGTSKASYFVVDFQAGKDVGLGLFGGDNSSVVSAGIRFAQFNSSSDMSLHGRPTLVSGPFYTVPGTYMLHGSKFHNYTAVLNARRSFHGIGPSLAWNASLPVLGSPSDMEATLDWGVNGSVLFGRQKARVHHQTTGLYKTRGPFTTQGYIKSRSVHGPYDHDRSRTVTIPNAGGFIGASLKFPNAKVSLGYRADFFFGAMDNGIDTARSADIGFFGPFANISYKFGG